MRRNRFGRSRRGRPTEKRPQYDFYKKHMVNIPMGSYKLLDEVSVRTGTPISRLVAIAIDNELSGPGTFKLDYQWPEFIEFEYASEAQRLLPFIGAFRRGTTTEALILLRYEYGVAEPQAVLGAILELQHQGLIQSYKPETLDAIDSHQPYLWVVTDSSLFKPWRGSYSTPQPEGEENECNAVREEE